MKLVQIYLNFELKLQMVPVRYKSLHFSSFFPPQINAYPDPQSALLEYWYRAVRLRYLRIFASRYFVRVVSVWGEGGGSGWLIPTG